MHWDLFGYEVPAWIYAPAFLTLWWGMALGARAVIYLLVVPKQPEKRTRFLGVFFRSLVAPVILLIFISGPIVLLAWSPLGDRLRDRVNLNIALAIAVIVASALFVDRLLRGLIDAYDDKIDFFRTGGGLIKGIERGLILGIGLLILMDTLGISITPIVASLGIGSLAVALALQPTLENLFAGMQIVVDRPVRQGHFVKLESGEEGYVEKIAWRTTWIRQLSNNMVIIPNKQLVSSRVTNYYYPSPDLAVLVELAVHRDSDLAKVERVTTEVAEEILKTTRGGVPEFKPFIRFHTVGESSIGFTVILRGQEFTDTYLLKHEFIKAVVKRYAAEEIVLPYPVRAIDLGQQGAEAMVRPAKA